MRYGASREKTQKKVVRRKRHCMLSFLDMVMTITNHL